MHGARSGAKLGKAHPNYRHGERSREAVALRVELNALLRAGQDIRVHVDGCVEAEAIRLVERWSPIRRNPSPEGMEP